MFKISAETFAKNRAVKLESEKNSISGLATTPALIAIENEIPDVL